RWSSASRADRPRRLATCASLRRGPRRRAWRRPRRRTGEEMPISARRAWAGRAHRRGPGGGPAERAPRFTRIEPARRQAFSRYVRPVPATSDMARARSALARKLRDALEQRGYLEVETPIAVPFAGQEPHLRPFETAFTPDPPVPPQGVHGARRLHLHTRPEYAMKRLLAREGFSRCYQLARVFRDGEVSRTHNPEFTLLELYASPGSAATIMADLEQVIFALAPEAPARTASSR